MGGSGRAESREKMEMAEKGVLIPVDGRPIYTVGKHQRVKKMGVSLAGRGLDKSSADTNNLGLTPHCAVLICSPLTDKKLCSKAQSGFGNALVDMGIIRI